MMYRPYPVMTTFALAALALLIWLGNWQMQRAAWKAGLVADHETASAGLRTGEAAPLEAVTCDDGLAFADAPTYPPSAAIGADVFVYGFNDAQQPGWRGFAVVELPCANDAGATHYLAQIEFRRLADNSLEGSSLLRWEAIPPRGLFSAPNDPAANEWHWFDLAAMEAAIERPVRLDPDRMLIFFNPDELPANLSRTPPSRHIGYAVTWYGMAIALIVLYGAFHARAGRLRFRK